MAFSRQLLEGLLDDDTALVEVRTADSLVREIVTAVDGEPRIVGPTELRELLNRAVAEASLGGNPLQARSMRQTLRRLGTEYLDSEIHSVIVARGLARIEDYLAAARPGRRVPLTALQRQAVWAVKEALATLLSEKGLLTWQGLRSRAAALVSERSIDEPYDAVVIDEAQDLDPTVLRVLVAACRSPERLFLTADANQSIYGNGFRWSDVHDVLRFRGRTGVLRTNHRSTEEIGSATQSYLAEGRLDEDEPEPAYEHSGPIPVVRFVKSEKAEADLLVQFLREAARECRLAPWVGAVLVPSEEAGRRIVTMLQAAEVDAAFMASRDLDLAARCVKVLTLRACKGLEFPVVALAGFVSQPWPLFRDDMPREQRTERLVQARRTLFVAMTRAMRALMVVGSAGYQSSLFAGFEPARWNTQ